MVESCKLGNSRVYVHILTMKVTNHRLVIALDSLPGLLKIKLPCFILFCFPHPEKCESI